MSNQKGNQYPAWLISVNFEVTAIDRLGAPYIKSKDNFASTLGISTDGTVWAVSLEPDPDQGGAKIYWSDGDGVWNEISSPDPGAIRITGGGPGSCYYLDSKNILRSLNTNGESEVVYNGLPILSVDYGGGYLWAIIPEKPGGIPILQFTKADSINWVPFDKNPSPKSISVNRQGDCYGIIEGTNMYFSTDGKSTGPWGADADGITLRTTFKNWNFYSHHRYQ